MARAIKNHHGEVTNAFALGLGNPLEVLGGRCCDVNGANTIGANGNLFHVETRAWVEHAAALRDSNHCNGVSASVSGQRGAVDGVNSNVSERLGAIADLFAVEEHRGIVFFAFTDDHDS